ncbi:hypothetical protein Tco_1012002 [Tanacetum coccineum]
MVTGYGCEFSSGFMGGVVLDWAAVGVVDELWLGREDWAGVEGLACWAVELVGPGRVVVNWLTVDEREVIRGRVVGLGRNKKVETKVSLTNMGIGFHQSWAGKAQLVAVGLEWPAEDMEARQAYVGPMGGLVSQWDWRMSVPKFQSVKKQYHEVEAKRTVGDDDLPLNPLLEPESS